ncbi:MAG: radical SAM protein [Deltaproteobacteria bacterium]|nr:radical SAM protein [Deltaproteobacteria bacterium]
MGDAAKKPRRLPLVEATASRSRGVPLMEPRAIDRRHRPIHCVWELTLRCDLACHHCGSRAGRARPDELSIDEALDVVRQLAELGVQEVTLIGGEAYLYEGWERVARAIRDRGMACAMVSGGRGIDADVAGRAADAGVQSLSVSIDGTPETHDRLRGLVGAHAAGIAALRHASAAGMQVALNTQINRLNMHELEDVHDRLVDVGGHGWQLALTVPAGRAADDPELLLQPYDLLELFPRLADLAERCQARGVTFLAGNNVGYFGPYEHRFRGLFRSGCTECTAGRLVLGLEANGDVKGCPSLPTRNWVGGNLRDHSLVDLWERTPELRFTRDRGTDDLWGYCADCYYAESCKAGCTWTSESFLGRRGNQPYCHHRALEHRAQGLRERLVPRSPAIGEPFDYGLWEIVVEPWPPEGDDPCDG